MMTWNISAYLRLLSASNPANNVRVGIVSTVQVDSNEVNPITVANTVVPQLNSSVLTVLQNTYGQTYFYPTTIRSTSILGSNITIQYLHNLDYNGVDDLSYLYSTFPIDPPPV